MRALYHARAILAGANPTSVMSTSDRNAYAAAAIGGVLLWLGASALGGRREAWDSSLYWVVAYPASIVVAGVVAVFASVRPWRWGLTIMLAQAVTLAITSMSFGLLPLGMILFAILAVPPMLGALVGAAVGARLRRG